MFGKLLLVGDGLVNFFVGGGGGRRFFDLCLGLCRLFNFKSAHIVVICGGLCGGACSLSNLLLQKIKEAVRTVDKRDMSPRSYVDTDVVKSQDVERLKVFADEGDAESCYYLSQIYSSYQMYQYDDEMVMGYVRMAAESGYAPAVLLYINTEFLKGDGLHMDWVFWSLKGDNLSADIKEYGSEEGVRKMYEFLDYCESVSDRFSDSLEMCIEKLIEYACEHIFGKLDLTAEIDWEAEQIIEGHLVARRFVQRANALPENLLLPLKEAFSKEFERYSDI